MKKKTTLTKALAMFLAFLLVTSQGVMAQSGTSEDKRFKQEELDQLLAPIALYQDALLAQIFMASTYPLEVVQAGRWTKENQNLKEDALAVALEKETWDPSVKSLVNFPQVLDFMNEKLDWTQKLGDAFLVQQKEVMDTVQTLRKKAKEQGNLESSKEQTVVVEKETQTIIIEAADPQIVYVPTYNPTVVYGTWWYPSYPPYYYYPPGYTAGGAMFAFGVGVAVGVAWGYAWGHCNWRGGDININVNRNTNINHNINRNDKTAGNGQWKHDPEHRKGVSYGDQATAQKFDRGASKEAASREAFRGRAETGRQDIAKGDAGQFQDRSAGNSQGSKDRPNTGSMDRGEAQQRKTSSELSSGKSSQRSDKSAFGSYNQGSQTRSSSNRGHQSMSSGRSGGGGRRR
jgi:hypothetical protein